MRLLNNTWNYIQRNRKLLLIGGCTLLVMHVLYAHGGCYENDDFVYAYYAVKGIKTETSACYFCDHFSLRWIPIIATSFFYKAFGLNEITTALFSTCCFLCAATLIYRMLRKESLLLIFAAFVLYFFNYTTIFYSHRLIADGGVMLFNFTAWYCYCRERFSQYKQTNLNAWVLSSSLMLAVVTKETVIIILPYWLLLIAVDLYRKRNLTFWLRAFLVFAVLAGIYLLYFRLATGEWLYRYHILQNNNYLGGEHFNPYRQDYLVQRLLYELWQKFLLNGDMQYILFGVAGFFYARTVFADPARRFLLNSFFILLLCSNFMSYTFTEYVPLWAMPRQYLFVMPFACIAGAYMIEAYLREPAKHYYVLICFLVADGFLSFTDLGGTKYVYYGITVVLLSRLVIELFNYGKKIQFLFLPLLMVVMSANYFYDFFFTYSHAYYDEQAVIENNLARNGEPAVVYVGDQISAAAGAFVLSFSDDKVHFVNVDTCRDFSRKDGSRYYLLLNSEYNPGFTKVADSLIGAPALNAHFRLTNKIGVARLYEMKDPYKMAIFKHYSTSGF